ncbi:MAG: small multi-drug export protein [Candidatus Aenigmarchaeota archaeon]|nr:small multi-drug export protein [Candidatus Aenigmarchaeota archaeon]
MLYEILLLVIVTFIPGLELRASIPFGIWDRPLQLPFGYVINGLGMDPFIVFTACVVANILLGELVFFGLNYLLPYVLKIGLLKKVYEKCVRRIQRKAKPHIEKYGPLELALFIGIPFPGTGVYSGALLAFLLGFRKRDFSVANVLGVLMAGITVTLITVGALGAFSFLL